MKRMLLLIFFVVLCSAKSTAQRQSISGNRWNVGMKLGLNAPKDFILSNTINEVLIQDFEFTSQVGGFVTMVGRCNINRFFLQLEASANYTHSQFSLDPHLLGFAEASITDRTINNEQWYSIDMPILLGYNLVKESKYTLALFAGPKARYILGSVNTVNGFQAKNLSFDKTYNPWSYNATLGIGTTIGALFVDVRYECEILPRKTIITYSHPFVENGTITLNRLTNNLSVSIGILF